MSAAGTRPRALEVVAGILLRHDGRILLAQRPGGRYHAGLWEFPGGKREPGEGRREALARELEEELGLTLLRAAPLVGFEYAYPTRRVALDFWQVTDWSGRPVAHEGQAWAWVWPATLMDLPLLAANRRLALALWLYGAGGSPWRRQTPRLRLRPPPGVSVLPGPGHSVVVTGPPAGRRAAALRRRWHAACREAGVAVGSAPRVAGSVAGMGRGGPLAPEAADFQLRGLRRRGRQALVVLRGEAGDERVFELQDAVVRQTLERRACAPGSAALSRVGAMGRSQPQWSRIQGVGRMWRYHLPPRPSMASSGFGRP